MGTRRNLEPPNEAPQLPFENVLFPARLGLVALKSTSYKDTEHALAELIDNSFDAGATDIGVAILADKGTGDLHALAVLDDGRGMGTEGLRRCLQFGYSGRDSVHDHPLGRFGVGLVAASCSQCSEITVMSWQEGEAAKGRVPAMRVKIPEPKDMTAELNEIPDVRSKALPKWAHHAFKGMAVPIGEMPSGTLVVWRDLHKKRRRPATLMRNLTALSGRVYRNFISSEELTLVVNAFDRSNNETMDEPQYAPPVDPMFLSNWDDKDLQRYGFDEDGEQTLFVQYTGPEGDSGKNQAGENQFEPLTVLDGEGEAHECKLLASYRDPGVLEMTKHDGEPGSTGYGRLAKRLQGVSILRAGREIELDASWLRVERTVDRWISVSFDFPPALDDVFQVSNDKQRVRGLSNKSHMTPRDIRDAMADINAEDEEDRDLAEYECHKVVLRIKQRLSEMQRRVGSQRLGGRGGESGPERDRPGDPSSATVDELARAGAREGLNKLGLGCETWISRPVSAGGHKRQMVITVIDDAGSETCLIGLVARATGAVAPRQAAAYLPAINRFVKPSSKAIRCVFFARPR